MDFKTFIDECFMGIIGFSAVTLVGVLGMMYQELRGLGEKIAVLLERTASHEGRIKKLEEEK
jgi:hypothetical protein